MVKVNGQRSQSKVHWTDQTGQSKVQLGRSNVLVKGLTGLVQWVNQRFDLPQHLVQLKWTWVQPSK